MTLDALAPRRHPVVLPKPESTRSLTVAFQSLGAAKRREKPVRGDQYLRIKPRIRRFDLDACRGPAMPNDGRLVTKLDPDLESATGEGADQRDAANSQSTATWQARLGEGTVFLNVTNALERSALIGVDPIASAQQLELAQPGRHQPLAAGLIERGCATFEDDRGQTALCGLNRQRQASGTPSGDRDVNPHRRTRAWQSQLPSGRARRR